MGRVYTDDKLLITKDNENNVGVELRTSSVNLKAERSWIHLGTIPIVGWDHNVQSLTAELYLPPGWTLLSSSGVDRLDGTWISTWELWDFFFILLIAMGTGKILGWKWSVLVVPTLGLTHGYYDAPSWVWVHLVFSLALLKVIKDGTFRKVIVAYRAICLLLVLIRYLKDQLRYGFNPQLSKNVSYVNPNDFGFYEEELLCTMQKTFLRASLIPSIEQMRSKGQRQLQHAATNGPQCSRTNRYGTSQLELEHKVFGWNGPVSKEHELNCL